MKKEISLFKDLKIYNWKENKNLPCRDGCRLYGCSLFLPHVFDHVLALNLNLFFYLFTFSFIWFRISLLNFAQSFSHTSCVIQLSRSCFIKWRNNHLFYLTCQFIYLNIHFSRLSSQFHLF